MMHEQLNNKYAWLKYDLTEEEGATGALREICNFWREYI